MLWSQLSNKLGYCIFRNDFLILFNNLNIFLVNSNSFIQDRVQKKYFFEFAAVATSRPILDNERRPLTFGHIKAGFTPKPLPLTSAFHSRLRFRTV